jgi:16S rRNA (cytidine1402-2'-O)-methyltransferase
MKDQLGKLYIVATPIGNLSDMTFRGVEILKSVDTILCEDTRTTGKLLQHYEIQNRTMSFHSHSKLSQTEKIKNMLLDGKNLALVSDAGTPCISDPGVMLVAYVRRVIPDIIISPIPGASALISALSVAGVMVHEFSFKGFVPHKKGRETFFREVSDAQDTVIFYESVHRILKTLASLAEYAPEKHVVIAREITKIFEQVITGNPAEIIEYFDNHPDTVRGEFVVIVGNPEK